MDSYQGMPSQAAEKVQVRIRASLQRLRKKCRFVSGHRSTGCGKTRLMNRSLHETESAESCYKASMQGNDEQQGAVFSYVSAEQRIAADHPLRRIRAMTDGALKELSPELDRLYASGGPPSIAAEKLLRGALLQEVDVRPSEQLLREE